jgi:hypothetical protein
MTCRLFIDEVGNGDLQGSATNDNVRYLSLTGILTKTYLHDNAIQPAMDDLKQDVFGRVNIVLHRREIVRREGPFTVLKDQEKSNEFDLGILRLVNESPYLAMTVTIDKREHLNKYGVWRFDPYHYCLRCLVERYVSWLRRNDLRGDVAIEPRFPKADKKVKNSFRLIYDGGSENVPSTLMQRHLLSHDIIFIGKQHNIAGMQLCDLLAHPSCRSMRFERDGREEPRDFGSMIVEILMERRYARHPTSKIVEGWGRKWLP